MVKPEAQRTPDSLSQALSLAVHELRTPVSIVSGYLRLLLREDGDRLTDQQRGMLEKTTLACARIGALVAEMGELGSLASHTLTSACEAVDLSALVCELARGVHEGRDRGVTVEPRVANRPVLVNGDRPRLSAVLRALMRSAVRERDEPGVIVAFCDIVVDGDSSWAVVAVGDPPTVQSLLDVASWSAPPEFDEWCGGLGLSLPIGRRVIDALGGRLWSAAGGRPRRGSALRLRLLDQDPHDS